MGANRIGTNVLQSDQKRWRTGWAGQVTWETRIGDLRLTVVAQPFLKRKSATVRWAGIAAEVPAEADTLGEILSHHCHADIGDYETLGECVVACEEYIERWTSGKTREVLCGCVEIFGGEF